MHIEKTNGNKVTENSNAIYDSPKNLPPLRDSNPRSSVPMAETRWPLHHAVMANMVKISVIFSTKLFFNKVWQI
jgi:hypothetical protein